MFCHFIITPLVISSWRSLFALYDLLFSDDTVTSELSCLALGFVLGATLLLLEEAFALMTVKVEREGFLYKLLLENACYLVIFAVNVLMWRGAWLTTKRSAMLQRIFSQFHLELESLSYRSRHSNSCSTRFCLTGL